MIPYRCPLHHRSDNPDNCPPAQQQRWSRNHRQRQQDNRVMDLPFEMNRTSMEPGLVHTLPWVAIPYAVILGVFAIVGTFGNILIIGSMTSGANRHVVGNYFIINLAICDIVVTLIINPMAIVGKPSPCVRACVRAWLPGCVLVCLVLSISESSFGWLSSKCTRISRGLLE